jgi:fucose 4-O-acetylase-like acetyltransferase
MQKIRLYFVDKLRTFLTCVVVVHHVVWMLDPAAGYNWGLSYQYKAEPAKAVVVIATYLLSADQAYFMGLFFVLAGYFTVSSYKRKGCWNFVMDRAIRLLIPVVVYELVIAPVMLTIAQPVADPDSPPGLRTAPNAFHWYFENYKGVGNNPM